MKKAGKPKLPEPAKEGSIIISTLRVTLSNDENIPPIVEQGPLKQVSTEEYNLRQLKKYLRKLPDKGSKDD